MENPWKITEASEIYQNPWIELTEYKVITPGGKPGIYGKVHFKNKAVGIVPYEDGKVWMVGQYRFPLEQYSWEIPEGGSPIEESPLDTARRELKEETGLTAANWEPILEMHLSNAVSDEWGIVYLATGLTHGEAEPEDLEILSLQQMTIEELVAEVDAGRITDSLTVAAAYKLRILQLEGKLS